MFKPGFYYCLRRFFSCTRHSSNKLGSALVCKRIVFVDSLAALGIAQTSLALLSFAKELSFNFLSNQGKQYLLIARLCRSPKRELLITPKVKHMQNLNKYLKIKYLSDTTF